MLLQFSFDNYRLFADRQTLSLASNGRLRSLEQNGFSSAAPGLGESRWLKGALIYGPNASGKSTVLSALQALKLMVLHSAKTTDPEDSLSWVHSFSLDAERKGQPTVFTVAFVSEDVRYEYRVAATRAKIWHESLRAFPKAHEQLWFSRDWDEQAQSYKWSPDRPTMFQRDTALEGYTLPNVLFLSKAIANNRSELGPVYRWFKEKLQYLDLSFTAGLGQQFTAEALAQGDSVLKERILSILRCADIGVTSASARLKEPRKIAPEMEPILKLLPPEVQEELGKMREYEATLTHIGKSGSVPLDWESESAGTQRLFALAGPWLDILENGLVACVDELETSMHPLMVRELLRLFFSPEYNTKGAQLIATTHNPLLLDQTIVRRDQIWFCDKDEVGGGHLYSLLDYRPREGESLVRGYLSGRYGAVPFIPRGLLGTFQNSAPEDGDE